MTLLRYCLGIALSLLVFACDRESQGSRVGDAPPHEHSFAAGDGSAPESGAPDSAPVFVKASGQLGPGRGTLIVDIKAPEGAELTEGAPFRVSARGADLTFPKEIDTKLDSSKLPVRLPLDVADGAQGPVELDVSYYFCTNGDDGSCQPERAKLRVEIDLTGGGPGGEAHLVHKPAV